VRSAHPARPASRARRTTKSAARLAATLLAATLLPACALAPKLEAPKLSIVDVQVVSAELWTQHLKVRLHVHNPNDRELLARDLDAVLEPLDRRAAMPSSTPMSPPTSRVR